MAHHPNRILLSIGAFCLTAVLVADHWTVTMAAEPPAPAQATLTDRFPAFDEVLRTSAPHLALLPEQGDALTLFKNEIGPSLGLKDAAMTIGARGLSPAVAQELLLPDLTRSATQLVRGFAAWRLSHAVRELRPSASDEQSAELYRQITTQKDWVAEGTNLEPALRRLLTLLRPDHPQETTSDGVAGSAPDEDVGLTLAEVAAGIETRTIQTVYREWFRLWNWKDQVRQQRGLGRLCGTWQWSIHNHQNHREEKTAVTFAPPGSTSAVSPAEIVVLGDGVYLRWETRAGMQEDSLLFSAEGQRLEGTFVNTAGGWGSITGKRTASCFSKPGDKPAVRQRRHQ